MVEVGSWSGLGTRTLENSLESGYWKTQIYNELDVKA